MCILFGILFIIISLLFLTYYYLKANQDDYNRPSFFNSKVRKYFLLFFAIFLLIFGEYILLIDGYTDLAWFLPLLYIVLYFAVRGIKTDNIITEKIFQYYKVFSDPEVLPSKKDQLIVPVSYMLSAGGLLEDFRKKADEYIEKRIKEGKIRGVKDLPSEAASILGSASKDKIRFIPENKISASKVEYYYNKVLKDKKYQNLTDYMSEGFWLLEAQLEKLFKNYAFIVLARPDFTEEEVDLVEANIIEKGKDSKDKKEMIAMLSGVSPGMARKMGWVEDLEEYGALAVLEFQGRFPDHKFSKKIKKQHKYSDQEIFDYSQNWEKLDISKIKLYS